MEIIGFHRQSPSGYTRGSEESHAGKPEVKRFKQTGFRLYISDQQHKGQEAKARSRVSGKVCLNMCRADEGKWDQVSRWAGTGKEVENGNGPH